MNKNILLAVVGLTPQVITETLVALLQQHKRVDEIFAITTRQGKELINAYLLPKNDGKYYECLREYGINPSSIDFGYDHVYTIKNENDIEIDDIVGEEENEYLLKKCLEITFKVTKSSDTAVFFSIAGGRKTMSACLMLAAQLYGRPQDRVYHVLISPEFESNRNFFFPPKIPIMIELNDSKGQPYLKKTDYATVKLINIPFISIREQLADSMLKEPKDPASLMLSIIKEDPCQLIIDLAAAKITYKHHEFDIMPARLALYAFFALQKKKCREATKKCRNCTNCYLTIDRIFKEQDLITELYTKIPGSREPLTMSDTGICNLNPENFNSYKAKLKRDLEKAFGFYAVTELAIESIGNKPDTSYGIKIDREKIRIIS